MTDIKEYWSPEIKEKYIGKKCVIVCEDIIKLEKLSEEEYKLEAKTYYNYDNFLYKITKSDFPRNTFNFICNEEIKELVVEGTIFSLENDKKEFITREEFEVDINMIRKSSLINDLIDDQEVDELGKIPVDVPPKVMKKIIEFLEYNIQPYHKIYQIEKPIRYLTFSMNINDYDDDVLGDLRKREEVRNWYADFASRSSRLEKADIIRKSFYLNIPELFNLFCLEFSMWYKKEENEVIQKELNLSDEQMNIALEMTREEMKKIKEKENEKNKKEIKEEEIKENN